VKAAALSLSIVVLFACSAFAAEPVAADKAAIFKAAGFKAKASKYVRCEDDSPSAMPGSIELQDLNGDGKAEAWVKESSTFCYGMTAEAFVLLGKDGKGNWTKLLDQVGMADVKRSKHGGWPDIEVGGPGMGPFPVYRWNGTKYVVGR
jgi:hypothetical protein